MSITLLIYYSASPPFKKIASEVIIMTLGNSNWRDQVSDRTITWSKARSTIGEKHIKRQTSALYSRIKPLRFPGSDVMTSTIKTTVSHASA